jgi:hypothetical protein
MKRRTLAEEWDRYHRTLYDGRLTGAQLREVKQAFYAGFQTFYTMALVNADRDDPEAEVAFFEGIDRELQAFAEHTVRGAANESAPPAPGPKSPNPSSPGPTPSGPKPH